MATVTTTSSSTIRTSATASSHATNIQTTNINGNTVIVGTPQMSYHSIKYRRKHQRQELAFTSGGMILMANSILMTYSLFQLPIEENRVFMSMFMVGGMIGAAAASFLLHKLRKSIHYYLCGILTIISGVLCVCDSYNEDLATAANFIAGLSYGITLLTCLIHASEITIKFIRGFNILNIYIIIEVGTFLFWIVQSYNLNIFFQNGYLTGSLDFSYNFAYGIFIIIFGIISLILTFIFVIESPIYLYEIGNNDAEAKHNLLRLRKETVETFEIIQDLEEMKYSVTSIQKTNENSFFTRHDIKPLLKIFVIRFAYILGVGTPISYIYMSSFLIYFEKTNFGTLFIVCRLVGHILAILLVDNVGRKLILILSFVLSGIMLIVLSSIYVNADIDYTTESDVPLAILSETFSTIGGWSLLYQFAIGLGSGGITLLLMTEAFGNHNKTYVNAVFIIMECLIHLIIIFTYTGQPFIAYNEVYIFLTGVVHICAGIFTFLFIPETSRKSLKETRELFCK